MLDWLDAHATAMQVLLSALTALIWIGYLQLILQGFLRQRRPKIMIELGAGTGLGTRCFVANLGFEPIYIYDIFVTLTQDGQSHVAVVTERDEMTDEQLSNPGEATNQGPLASGKSYDIGSIGDLLDRARRQWDAPVEPRDIDALQITVVATTAASTAVIAARRTYRLHWQGESCRLRPTEIAARQVRSLAERIRLKRTLKERLKDD